MPRHISAADLPEDRAHVAEGCVASEEYDANGVDRTLIRACLRETPLECLQMLEEMHQLAESVAVDSKQISSSD